MKIFDSIRYVQPNADKNPARWPNTAFWDLAIEEIKSCMKPYISNADRGKIISDTRRNIIDRYKQQIVGLFPPYSVALGNNEGNIEEVVEKIKNDIQKYAEENPKKLGKKFKIAKEKFEFIDK